MSRGENQPYRRTQYARWFRQKPLLSAVNQSLIHGTRFVSFMDYVGAALADDTMTGYLYEIIRS